MSRPGITQSRNLTLTEELEKLEQSITLTLQEIDSNFSKAHRIVTTSILPIVEQYAEQSRNVWEGSKFWKQFFESSANVSLSGYEERPPEEGDDSLRTDTTHTTLEESEASTFETPSSEHFDLHTQSHLGPDDEEVDLSNLTISPSRSTPRATTRNVTKQTVNQASTFAEYPSPYETLKQEINSSSPITDAPQPTLNLGPGPTTPNKRNAKSPYVRNKSSAIATTPDSSPFLPPTTVAKPPPSTQKRDPLLHRVLDRNYRIQATPHTTKRNTTTSSKYALDSSPPSSPEIQAPTLHAEIFSSPVRQGLTPARHQHQRKAPKPGISVITPAKLRRTSAGRQFSNAGKKEVSTRRSIWPSTDEDDRTGQGLGGDRNGHPRPPPQSRYDEWADSDSDDGGLPFGQSPPKTMTFHVPQRRMLRTPAKEASKRMVSDLLLSAGHGGAADDEFTDDINDIDIDVDLRGDGKYGDGGDITSPSVVKAAMIEDDTF